MSATTYSVVTHTHDAEVRFERGERVVGDLRLGRGHHGDQRRLADVREPDRARRRRRASARAAASAPRRVRLVRRTKAPVCGSTGSGRCRGRLVRPRAARNRSPSWTRSASTSPIVVAHDRSLGHRDQRVVAAGAVAALALAVHAVWPPAGAGDRGTPSSDATLRSATSQTSPPLPPSPPSGPPFGTCASRRNATQPAPPSPPFTWRFALVDEARHPLRLGGRTRNLGKALQSGPTRRRKQYVGEPRATLGRQEPSLRARSDDGAVLVEFALVIPSW